MTQFASTLYPQTNPTNPALLEVRESLPSYVNKRLYLSFFLDFLDLGGVPSWSAEHKAHARSVVGRMERFTG